MRRARGRLVVAAVVAAGAGCSLLTDLRGLSGESSPDAASEAAGSDAAAALDAADGAACPAGFADCDGLADNACEMNVSSNLANCGACNRPCVLNHGSASCVAGKC